MNPALQASSFPSRRQRLICVGHGLVGHRALRELTNRMPDRYAITVFGEEPRPCYDRIRLSAVLSGEATADSLGVADPAWFAEREITFRPSTRIAEIDRKRRVVVDTRGEETPYDHLLLCTGSRPRTLSIPGMSLGGVLHFRNLEDVTAMLDRGRPGMRAVILGGGLLGLEAAAGLRKRGLEATVLQLAPRLMESQLDDEAAAMLLRFFTAQGVDVRLSANTVALHGENGDVREVELETGERIRADLVILAIGIDPRIELARQAGLLCKHGVVVNDRLRTSDTNISALGECVEHQTRTYGLVAPLYEMARVWAEEMQNPYSARYQGADSAARLKVAGVDVFSAGTTQIGEGFEVAVFKDERRAIYRKLLFKGERLRGAILYGDATDGAWYGRMIHERIDISDVRDDLILGRAYVENVRKDSAVAAVPLRDDSEICGCNGVCKKDIVRAIWAHGLTNVDGIRRHTKASASCGSCTKLVQQVLVEARGRDAERNDAIPAMCGCTEHSHDHVRAAIVAQKLESIPIVMRTLGWATPDGCHLCRPAINYYLLCAWPGEYIDQERSRVVNERLHANIQKDGTYSVVPRMWGGLTNARELRAIADVVDKFAIPTVKLTGGQRIDLIGVRKQDLPAVWATLGRAGFVSGHAYGKALRTVKTCVGMEWCRFGTQDSTTMGVTMEKQMWGAWSPHKVKMSVSGCPRNCAEATIKDLGVVAIESGWELYVGGNGGMKVRVADLLAKVSSPDEVMEYATAFFQLYREQAHYLERTSYWTERVGLDYIRNKIVEDPAERQRLALRFKESQSFAQVDPWAKIAGLEEQHHQRSLPIVQG